MPMYRVMQEDAEGNWGFRDLETSTPDETWEIAKKATLEGPWTPTAIQYDPWKLGEEDRQSYPHHDSETRERRLIIRRRNGRYEIHGRAPLPDP